jgi:hypothetical protein
MILKHLFIYSIFSLLSLGLCNCVFAQDTLNVKGIKLATSDSLRARYILHKIIPPTGFVAWNRQLALKIETYGPVYLLFGANGYCE